MSLEDDLYEAILAGRWDEVEQFLTESEKNRLKLIKKREERDDAFDTDGD